MSEQEKKPEEKLEEKKEMTIEDAKNILSSGRLGLVQPIFVNGKEVKELPYNFKKVTGMEFLDALDGDTATRKGAFNLSARQALNLFLAGVTHGGENINGSDFEDIRKQLDIEDVQKAVQVAVSFFNASSRSGAERISTL